MKTYHYADKRPSIYPQFMMDDFGDEIMTVHEVTPDIDSFQIKMHPDTYWHIFDLSGKVLEWADGHDEE
jgi:hypothetical protein